MARMVPIHDGTIEASLISPHIVLAGTISDRLQTHQNVHSYDVREMGYRFGEALYDNGP